MRLTALTAVIAASLAGLPAAAVTPVAGLTGAAMPAPAARSSDAVRLAEFRVAAVPEPMSWGLLLAGFAVIGLAGRRRRSVKSVVA